MQRMYYTQFGSIGRYQKGGIEIITGGAKEYAFSNLFEVASRERPYDKVVVGKNLQYVVETLRAEGNSAWFTAAHDEFALLMDGEVEVHFVELQHPERLAPAGTAGSIKLEGVPEGKKMGWVRLHRGHQALLPKGAAYQFRATCLGVLLLQTVLGAHSVQKWHEICYR
jgi:hypothetical protein